MTVAAAPFRSGPYAGDGVIVLFTVTFVVQDEEALAVYVKDLNGLVTKKTKDVDYTIEFVANHFVRFTTAPLSTDTVLILNEEAYLQDTDFTIGDSVDLASLQTTVDRLARQVKQLLEIQNRALRFEKFSTKTELEIAAPAAADDGRAVVYDAASDSYSHATLTSAGTLSVSSYAETLLDDASASAAQATLGLVPDTNVTASSTFDTHVADLDAHSKFSVLQPPQGVIDLTTSASVAFQTVVATTTGGDVARYVILRVRILLYHQTQAVSGGRSVIVRLRQQGDISTGNSIINVDAVIPDESFLEPTIINVERTVFVPVSSGSQSWQYEIAQTNGVGTNQIEIVQEGYIT